MRMILYISTARRGLSQHDIIEILREARSRNSLCGITGILLFDRVRFIEVLEGPSAAVEDTFSRIQKDDRHLALVKLEDKPIARRQFADQAMAAYGTAESDLAHSVEEVDAILANLTDLTLRDQLKSFARIRATESDHSG